MSRLRQRVCLRLAGDEGANFNSEIIQSHFDLGSSHISGKDRLTFRSSSHRWAGFPAHLFYFFKRTINPIMLVWVSHLSGSCEHPIEQREKIGDRDNAYQFSISLGDQY